MTEENLRAVRMLRAEAENLRLACIAKVGAGAMLHSIYDRTIPSKEPLIDAVLLGRLGAVPTSTQ